MKKKKPTIMQMILLLGGLLAYIGFFILMIFAFTRNLEISRFLVTISLMVVMIIFIERFGKFLAKQLGLDERVW